MLKEEFVTDPMVICKKVTAMMIAILVIFVILILFNGDPLPGSKFAMRGFKTATSVAVFISVIFTIVTAMAWLIVLSVQSHTTTRVDESGISIDTKPFILGEPRSEFIPWSDIEVIRHVKASRGGHSLRALVRGQEIILMSRYLGNGYQFDRLSSILESKKGVI